MDSFIWKNLNSFDDFNIIIQELPSIPKPEKVLKTIQIEGRDGDLVIDTNSYKPISFQIKCILLEANMNNNFWDWTEKIDKVKTWLEGYDKLILSWMENRYYDARITAPYSIEQSRRKRGEFIITVNCQPFAFDTFNQNIKITGQNTDIYNAYTYSGKPKITVFGQGNITLSIKDYFGAEQIVNLFNVVGEITIDSILQECYKQPTNTNPVLCNSKMLGEFPILKVEHNFISWTGNVTSINVLTNFRFL